MTAGGDLHSHSVDRPPGRAGIATQPLERGPLAQALSCQRSLGLLDHHAMVQCPLQLPGQLRLQPGDLLRLGRLLRKLGTCAPLYLPDPQGRQPQLPLIGHDRGEVLQHTQRLGGEVAGGAVDDVDGAKPIAVVGDDRRGRVELQPQLAPDQRMVERSGSTWASVTR